MATPPPTRPTFSGKPPAIPASLVAAIGAKALQEERDGREKQRVAEAEVRRQQLDAKLQQDKLDRAQAQADLEDYRRARDELPEKVKTPERIELERQQRKLASRSLKGKKLAEMPVRKAVVELKVEGWTHAEVAKHLDIKESTVARLLKEWQLAESPSEETTEQLRKIMLNRLEKMHRQAYRRYQSSDDPRDGELVLKVMDRASKLMGTDLMPSSVHLSISAESIARFLGWDPEPGGPATTPAPVLPSGPVIDGEAEEEEDDDDTA